MHHDEDEVFLPLPGSVAVRADDEGFQLPAQPLAEAAERSGNVALRPLQGRPRDPAARKTP